MCQQDLELRIDAKGSPFLRSFQRRLAAIRGLENAITTERSVALAQKLSRDYVDTKLSSREHPQLHILNSLKSFGLVFLRIFPQFHANISDPFERQELLVAPLVTFCQELTSIQDLSLFSSWSPPSRPPQKLITLDISSVRASTGDGGRAIDGIPFNCWCSSGARGTWSVVLQAPSSLSAVRITWASSISFASAGNPIPCGAPAKLIILVKRFRGKRKSFETVGTFDVDQEYQRSSNWRHTYPLNITDVLAIRLTMINTSCFNSSGQIKIYNFEALTDDLETKWVDPFNIFTEMHTSLVSLCHVHETKAVVLEALFSLVRISGSLSILLSLVTYLQRDESMDTFVREHTPEPLLTLLHCIRKEEISVRDLAYNARANKRRLLDDVHFHSTLKSNDVIISEGGKLSTSGNISNNSYVLLSCVMDSGSWEWEFSLVKDDHGDETTCFGVSTIPVTNSDYQTSKDMWLLRCYGGELFHGSKVEVTAGNRSPPHIHPDDICRFTYECDKMTLSLAVNDVDYGVIFEHVPVGVSPIVLYYGAFKSARLLSVHRKGGQCASLSADVAKEVLPPCSPPPSVALVQKSTSAVTLLLQYVSNLSNARSLLLSMDRMSGGENTTPPSSCLEYPFCIQVSRDVLSQLMELLDLCSRTQSGDDFEIQTTSVLHIIDVQFFCLLHSNIDPVFAGFQRQASVAPDKLLTRSSSLLCRLASSELSTNLCIASATAFARGSFLFLPQISERLELTRVLVMTMSRGLTPAMSTLLLMLLNSLSTCEQVLNVINLYKTQRRWRGEVFDMISSLVRVLSERTISHLSGQEDSAEKWISVDDFVTITHKFMTLFQEQLTYECITVGHESNTKLMFVLDQLLFNYSNVVIKCSIDICRVLSTTRCKIERYFTIEMILKNSILSVLLSPLIHTVCLCCSHIDLMRDLMPSLIDLMRESSAACKRSQYCRMSLHWLCARVQRSRKPSTISGYKGWTPVRAVFDDSDPSFSISSDGLVYSSVQSSNTCATVSVGFSSPTRAAWEFRLEIDTVNDECSVFGAAQTPIHSRCYSSSPDLWMRRSYNGYMYARGRTTGHNLDKIHPGDVVRIEFDGVTNTLSYGLNGSEMVVAFTDVMGEVHPACGSYRSGVQIRLLKVEVYGGTLECGKENEPERSPSSCRWVVSDELTNSRDASVLSPVTSKESLREEKDPEKRRTWVTARGDSGACDGVHEWSFELLEKSKVPLAFGVVIGGNPYPSDRLAGPCFEQPKPVVKPALKQNEGTTQLRNSLTMNQNEGQRGREDRDVEVDSFILLERVINSVSAASSDAPDADRTAHRRSTSDTPVMTSSRTPFADTYVGAAAEEPRFDVTNRPLIPILHRTGRPVGSPAVPGDPAPMLPGMRRGVSMDSISATVTTTAYTGPVPLQPRSSFGVRSASAALPSSEPDVAMLADATPRSASASLVPTESSRSTDGSGWASPRLRRSPITQPSDQSVMPLSEMMTPSITEDSAESATQTREMTLPMAGIRRGVSMDSLSRSGSGSSSLAPTVISAPIPRRPSFGVRSTFVEHGIDSDAEVTPPLDVPERDSSATLDIRGESKSGDNVSHDVAPAAPSSLPAATPASSSEPVDDDEPTYDIFNRPTIPVLYRTGRPISSPAPLADAGPVPTGLRRGVSVDSLATRSARNSLDVIETSRASLAPLTSGRSVSAAPVLVSGGDSSLATEIPARSSSASLVPTGMSSSVTTEADMSDDETSFDMLDRPLIPVLYRTGRPVGSPAPVAAVAAVPVPAGIRRGVSVDSMTLATTGRSPVALAPSGITTAASTSATESDVEPFASRDLPTLSRSRTLRRTDSHGVSAAEAAVTSLPLHSSSDVTSDSASHRRDIHSSREISAPSSLPLRVPVPGRAQRSISLTDLTSSSIKTQWRSRASTLHSAPLTTNISRLATREPAASHRSRNNSNADDGPRIERRRKSVFSYEAEGVHALAWCTDGSLWVSGEKKADGFGLSVLPLEQHACVSVRVDRLERTVSYYVNGCFIGTAFGPMGSGATVHVPLPEVSTPDGNGYEEDTRNTVFPAGSVSSSAQSVRIRPSGFYGSVVLPQIVYLQKTCASVIGRLVSALVIGPDVDKEEKLVIPWLQSPLIIGGLDKNFVNHNPLPKGKSAENSTKDLELCRCVNSVRESYMNLDGSFSSVVEFSDSRHATRGLGIKVFRAEAIDVDLSGCLDRFYSLTIFCNDVIVLNFRGSIHVDGESFPSWEDPPTHYIEMYDSMEAFLRIEICSPGYQGNHVCLGVTDIDLSSEILAMVDHGCTSLPLSPHGLVQIGVSIIYSDRFGTSGHVTQESSFSTVNEVPLQSINNITNDMKDDDIFKDAEPTVSLNAEFLLRFVGDDTKYVTAKPLSSVFVNWLEDMNPKDTMRATMEKASTYSFPQCEKPYIACLLKHCGLVDEARQAVETILNSSRAPSPSSNMLSLWDRVKQLRSYLRAKRQQYKASESSPSATNVSSGASVSSQPKSEGASAEDETRSSSENTSNTKTSDESLGPLQLGGIDQYKSIRLAHEAKADDSISPQSLVIPSRYAQARHSSDSLTVSDSLMASEEGIEIEGPFYMRSQNAVVWRSQPVGTQCRYNGSGSGNVRCSILSLGVDVSSQFVYVRFRVTSDVALGAMHTPINSRLYVGDSSLLVDMMELENEEDPDEELAGILRFNLAEVNSPDSIESSEVQFEFGAGGYEITTLLTPLSSGLYEHCKYGRCNNIACINCSLNDGVFYAGPARSFSDLCERIEMKSKFLVSVAWSNEENLTQSDVNNAFEACLNDWNMTTSKLALWRSIEGQAGWNRVFEMLRDNKKSKNAAKLQASIGSSARSRSPASSFRITKQRSHPQHTLVRNASPAVSIDSRLESESSNSSSNNSLSSNHATMSAFSIFVMSEKLNWSPVQLQELLLRRERRALYRAYALLALSQVLRISDVMNDPFAVEELLTFLRGAFVSAKKKILDPDADAHVCALLGCTSRYHYLANLEGCSADSLFEVQSAFVELFGTVSSLVIKYINLWEICADPHRIPSLQPQKVSLPFEDFNVGITDVINIPAVSILGPLRVMLALWSLHFSTRDSSFLTKCNIIPSLHKLLSLESHELAVTMWQKAATELLEYKKAHPQYRVDDEGWKLWSSAYVQDGLRCGTLGCRSIMFHLLNMPNSILDEKDKDGLGLLGDFNKLLNNCDVSDVSLLYEQVICMVHTRQEKYQKEMEEKRQRENEEEARRDEERRSHLLSACIPIFDASATGKSDDIVLESACQVASLKFPRSADFKVGCVFCTVCYDVRGSGCQDTGNYFEAELLEATERDIGVGLAVRGVFPLNNQMPGWVPHSYGYHGDDGKKFGIGSTSDTWPTWDEGDVIGCGFDSVGQSIFYTLNGRMLGVAFTNVVDERLTPVIGFHSQTTKQKVRINFGVFPFRYTGPEVIVNKKAEEERMLMIDLSTLHTIGEVEEEEEEKEEVKVGGDMAEAVVTMKDFHRRVSVLQRKFDDCAAQLSEINSLRSYASALMRFLLTASCFGGHDSESEAVLNMNADMCLADFFGSGGGGGGGSANSSDFGIDSTVNKYMDHPSAANMEKRFPLQKLLSAFGTDKKLTKNDCILFQKMIIHPIQQEIILGASYLSNNRNTLSPSSRVKGDIKQSWSSGTIKFGGHKSIRDLLFAASKPMGVIPDCPSLENLSLDEISESNSRFEEATMGSFHIQSSACGYIEPMEIEVILYEHISMFNVLLSSKVILDEFFSEEKSLEALLSLLHNSSPRIQRVVANTLRHCLPLIPGDRVCGNFPSNWTQDYLVHRISGTHERTQRSFSKFPTVSDEFVIEAFLDDIRYAIRLPTTALMKLMSVSDEAAKESFVSQLALSQSEIRNTLPPALGSSKSDLVYADHLVSILQRMFVTKESLWVRPILAQLTEAIRGAVGVLTTYDGDFHRFATSLDENLENSILFACAACSVISGLDIPRSGSAIETASGEKGILVSVNDQTKTAIIVMASHCHDNDGLHHMEQCESEALHTIATDSNSISYTLFPQHLVKLLISLLKRLLILQSDTVRCTAVTDEDVRASMLLWRLQSFLSSSISVLLSSNEEELLDLMDDKLLKDLMASSLLPTGLPFFPKNIEINRLWAFCQGTVLDMNTGFIPPSPLLMKKWSNNSQPVAPAESEGTGKGDTPGNNIPKYEATDTQKNLIMSSINKSTENSSIKTDDKKISPSDITTAATVEPLEDTSTDSEAVALLVYGEKERSRRKMIAKAFGREFHISEDVCLRLLEYFMEDGSLTRKYLEEHSSSIVSSSTLSSNIPPAATNVSGKSILMNSDMSDEYLLRNIEYQTIEPHKEPIVVPYERTFEKILCAGKEKQSKIHMLSVGTLVSKTTLDGSCTVSGGPLGMVVSPGPAENELIVSFCDDDLGIALYSTTPCDTLRLVTSLFERSPLDLPRYLNALEKAKAILHLRAITNKLLYEGYHETYFQKRESLINWMLLLKVSYSIERDKLFNRSGMSNRFIKQPGLSLKKQSKFLDPPTHLHDILNIKRQGKDLMISNSYAHYSALLQRLCSSKSSRLEKSLKSLSNFDIIGLAYSPSTKTFNNSHTDVSPNAAELTNIDASSVASNDLVFVIDSLLSDIENNFGCLTDPLCMPSKSKEEERMRNASGQDSTMKSEDMIVVASPHPFTSPHECCGRIDIPTGWRGAIVSFHPSSATPSENSTLRFFISQKDADEDRPSYEFWGCDGIHAFRTIRLPGVESLFYRFFSNETSEFVQYQNPTVGNEDTSKDEKLGKDVNADSESQLQPGTHKNSSAASRWGYEFYVQPLRDLNIKVSRDLELVWNGSMNTMDAKDSRMASIIDIWRPRASSNFISTGDIVTTTGRQPRGAILVDKQHSKPPVTYKKVFAGPKLNLIIWRPIPPPGYVALGDVAVSPISHAIPSLQLIACVPLWAVKKCPLGMRVISRGSGDPKIPTISLW